MRKTGNDTACFVGMFEKTSFSFYVLNIFPLKFLVWSALECLPFLLLCVKKKKKSQGMDLGIRENLLQRAG